MNCDSARLLTNDGMGTRQALETELSSCQAARMAVAFVSRSGVEALRPGMRSCLGNEGVVRVIAGEDFWLTDPDAIADLKALGARVRLFSCRSKGIYHPKLFLFSRGEEASIVLGSANLTGEALSRNVEVGVLLRETIDGELVQAAGRFFASLWNDDRAVPASDSYLERYRAGFELAKMKRAVGEEAVMIGEPEVADAPERKPRTHPPVREMCRGVMAVGERLPIGTIVERVRRAYPEWDHGLTPNASIRRDLMQFSTKHLPAGEALFGWREEEPGFYTRLM
jgi:HKD family nuclease